MNLGCNLVLGKDQQGNLTGNPTTTTKIQTTFLIFATNKNMLKEPQQQHFATTAQLPITCKGNNNYSRRGILRCESIYGRHYQSPGGKLVTQFFCDSLLNDNWHEDHNNTLLTAPSAISTAPFTQQCNGTGLNAYKNVLPALEQDFSILDIGCGLGGACHEFLKRGAATVVGVDKCADMIQIATERLSSLPPSNNHAMIEFQCADASTLDSRTMFNKGSFSIIWTRDTLLYVKDKLQIWNNMSHWLKPQGRLFFTDFTLGPQQGNSTLMEYATKNGYYLVNTEQIKSLASSTGITIDHEIDLSNLYVSIKQNDIKILHEKNAELLEQGYTQDELVELEQQWNTSMQFVANGHMKWTCCFAHKI